MKEVIPNLKSLTERFLFVINKDIELAQAIGVQCSKFKKVNKTE